MMVSIHLGSIFNVKADVFTLPVDKYLRLDSDVIRRAGSTFDDSFNRMQENAFWSKSLPLVRPTVVKVDQGDVLSCEGEVFCILMFCSIDTVLWYILFPGYENSYGPRILI